MIETLEDIVEQVADWVNAYGAHDETCTQKRPCRMCFTQDLRHRIDCAAEVDRKLNPRGAA